MNLQTRKIASAAAGALLAFAAGVPALADDTELMLKAPDTASKPNILFILDTSGSMGDEVMTQEPYNPNEDYIVANGCDIDRVYWTTVDVPPDCGTTTQSIPKSSFVCAAAAGRLLGIGSYSDTMVQYRETGTLDVFRWQELEAGVDAIVECQADSGEHGSGTAGELWASNDSADAFTDDPARELAWGSGPATVTYTVYDGNYLNWKASPEMVELSKMAILKSVASAVLNSVTDVNVGIMRFNDNAGGAVIKAMSDLDADRASILTTIDNLNAAGATPLAESLYEAALYWRGMNAFYGESINENPTDPAALLLPDPEVYRGPVTEACAKNYNVLLSDGIPNNDAQAPSLVENLTGFLGSCDGSGDGRCLDDIAAYLATVDIDPVMEDDQFVSTHTIAFDLDDDDAIQLLRDTATESEGSFFFADDVETLALALLNIISEISERSLSFTAPSLSVNAFNRTQNLNDLYMTVFAAKTNVHWPGNLKKYRVANGQIIDANDNNAVDPSTGFFDEDARSLWTDGDDDGNDVMLGGAAHEQPASTLRNLYTNNAAGPELTLTLDVNRLTPSNADAFDATDFGLTGAAEEPTKDELIRWMLGEDLRDEDIDGATNDARNAMGDPLHSQPAAVVYGGSPEDPDVVVYTGTNDGYLHAIAGDTGAELWSFVPMELLADMNRLYFDPTSSFKHYGIDGNIVPVINDENGNGEIESGEGDFVYLLFGMRRGGSSYYALDVTDKNTPVLKWVSQEAEYGQSWSTPVVSRMNINGTDRVVVVIGGGYDSVHDTRTHPSSPDAQGAGIHFLDLESGARLWRAGPDDDANLTLSAMTRAMPNEIRVIDMNGDRRADRMYASDLGGQLWRFDIANGEVADELVEGGVIAQLGAEGLGSPTDPDTRRFYNAPDVAIFNDPLQGRRFISISIGSGYRAHPLDETAADRFYSIRDEDVFNQLDEDAYANYDVVTEADLEDVAGRIRVVIEADDRGWMFTLPPEQKVIADSVTFNDSVFFVGFSPEENQSNPCQPSTGRNFLYEVSIVNGDPVVNNLDQLLPEEADAERSTPLAQGGIAASPSFLFPSSTDPDCEGAACSPPPVACVGVECFDPGFVNAPVRTLWTQDGIQ